MRVPIFPSSVIYSISNLLRVASAFCLITFFAACSGGGGDSGRAGGDTNADFDCDGACSAQRLTQADVQLVLNNTLRGASVLGVNATVAVVDRVGNVLAVYQMPGATPSTLIGAGSGAQGGLEGLTVPATLAAISKAGTGAYLSSQGNAFSTRTASQIVQEHFNPGERNQPGGPLFGVQFSQLLCSDVTIRNPEFADGRPSGSKFSFGGLIGPRPLPLGLSADPGGLPLYKQGDLVGGVGIEFDGVYRVDRNVLDTDNDPEERLALMATLGFEAPSQRVAPNMNVGKSLRYTDISYEELEALPEISVAFDPSALVTVPEFTDGQIREGALFGTVESGVVRTTRAGVPAMILVNPDGSNRYPSRGGTALAGGMQLTATEVEAILDSALFTAFRARAAIRRPLDTAARVSIWVVDTLGNPLGMVRSEDAPVFGIDVALQKGRGAAFMSSPDASAVLQTAGFGHYLQAVNDLFGQPMLNGQFAFPDRAIGNLSRPYFPDGIEVKPHGPLSLPFPGTEVTAKSWSPFNTGFQLDVVLPGLAQALGLIPSGSFPDACPSSPVGKRIAGGFQIFPGSVPLYRGYTLIGAIGVSGDGIDQDDLISFYGASRRGLDAVGHADIGDPVLGFNAPKEMRSDVIPVVGQDIRLRYVNCPEAPFRGDNDQNVCDGL